MPRRWGPVASPVECKVCNNGLLEYMMDSAGEWFLECEECMTGYRGIDGSGETFRCEDLHIDYRPATQAEVDLAMKS